MKVVLLFSINEDAEKNVHSNFCRLIRSDHVNDIQRS